MNRPISLSILVLTVAGSAFAWQQGVWDEVSFRQSGRGAPSSQVSKSVDDTSVSAASSSTVPGSLVASAPEAAKAIEVDEPATQDAQPSFDVVRVQPDGSALIAGRGAPNTVLRLENGSDTLAETKTDATGSFVLDLTLQPGEHRLRLAAENADRSDPSGEEALVSVPEKHKKEDLLVMVERPGEPSRILSVPQGPDAVQSDTPSEIASVSPRNEAASAVPTSGLKIEAVEAEGGKLFVAGAAKRDRSIRIYLDDKLVSEIEGGDGDRFIASAQAEVGIGDHVVRADEVDASGRVVARVEVPFNRPDAAPLAAVASAASPRAGGAAVGVSDATASKAAAAPQEVASAQAAPATTVQPALETVESRVIIRRGDTLWRISRNTYGRGSRFTVIVLANGDQIRDPNRIYPGQVFRMPENESSGQVVN